MNPIRQHMASLLTEAAWEGLEKLDKRSQAAKELRALDLDVILEEDIHKVCSAITFSEITAIMSLAAKLKSEREDKERVKEDIKKIASRLVERVEKEMGSLSIPSSCRDLLFNL